MKSRRTFLARATYAGAGITLLGLPARAAHASLSGNWGVPLYTLRSAIA